MKDLLKQIRIGFEKYRGTGRCIRCSNSFGQRDIEDQFRVSYKGKTKLSLICKGCRKEIVDGLVMKWG